MTKLTDSQLIVLSAAAAREDGLAVIPAKMTKAAAAKVGASLIARKLMREVRAKPGAPVWREDEDGRSLSLVILNAARKAIGVEESLQAVSAGPADTLKPQASAGKSKGAKRNASTDAGHTQAPPAKKNSSKNKSKVDQKTHSAVASVPASSATTPAQGASPRPTAPRGNSKQALVIAMLSAKAGTTLDALIEATGWLPHTTRAALTGLRKRGHLIERSKADGETSVYRIAAPEPVSTSTGKAIGSNKADLQAAA